MSAKSVESVWNDVLALSVDCRKRKGKGICHVHGAKFKTRLGYEYSVLAVCKFVLVRVPENFDLSSGTHFNGTDTKKEIGLVTVTRDE